MFKQIAFIALLSTSAFGQTKTTQEKIADIQAKSAARIEKLAHSDEYKVASKALTERQKQARKDLSARFKAERQALKLQYKQGKAK